MGRKIARKSNKEKEASMIQEMDRLKAREKENGN